MVSIMRGRFRLDLILILPFFAPVSAPPQAEQEAPFVMKENVNLVLVPVSVKGRDGRLVHDLDRDNFRLFEDGHPKAVQYFSNEFTPLSAVVLVDTGMSAKYFSVVSARPRALANAFGPSDEEAIAFFDKTI